MSFCIDANVFITAWHVDYPSQVFPSLYQEMNIKLPAKIIIIKPIFEEIEPFSGSTRDTKYLEDLERISPVRFWLQQNMNIKETLVSDKTKQKALELQSKYETYNGSKGANEVDITLIAFASLNNHTVVTCEKKQPDPPGKKSNYKIPLICQKENVKCMNFVELLIECNIQV